MPEEDDPLCNPFEETYTESFEFEFPYEDSFGDVQFASIELERVIVNDERRHCAVAIEGQWVEFDNCDLSSGIPQTSNGGWTGPSAVALKDILDVITIAPPRLPRCVNIDAAVTVDIDREMGFAVASLNVKSVYLGELSTIYVATVDVKYPTGSVQTFYVYRDSDNNMNMYMPTPARPGNACGG